MYSKSAGVMGLGAGAGANMLPFTGFNILWFILAAFALITAGAALLRIAPRREG